MLNIMVVDDSKVIRYKLKEILTELGHNVIAEAENGFDAIEMYKKYKSEKLDLVTMDLNMTPKRFVKNGLDAVKYIREYDKYAKIIMSTTDSDKTKILEAIKNGASGYILKPLNKEKIESAINKIINTNK